MDSNGAIEINSIEFGLLSAEQMRRYSVCQVTAPKGDGVNQTGVNDARMGVMENGMKCVTCGKDNIACPGHFGHIELAVPIVHPLLFPMKMIVAYLNMFCHGCSRVLVSGEYLASRKIDKILSSSRYLRILKITEKINLCPHCNAPHFKSTIDDGQILEICPNTGRGGVRSVQKVPIETATIKRIFDNMTREDLAVVSLPDAYDVCHPRNLILTVLPVIPPRARPESVVIGMDRTLQYHDIVKCNANLRALLTEYAKSKKSNDEQEIQLAIGRLNFTIQTLMDNSAKRGNRRQATYHTGRAKLGIKEVMSGKGGYVRHEWMSKRVNGSARAVIVGDPTIEANEVVVPNAIAKNISVPVKVQRYNISKIQNLVNIGEATLVVRGNKKTHLAQAMKTAGTPVFPSDIITRNGRQFKPDSNFVLQQGDSITRADGEIVENVQISERREFEVCINDTVYVFIQEGMWCIVNRQPTLHKGGLFALKVRRMRTGMTICLPMNVTTALNADFDGDRFSLSPTSSCFKS